VAAEHVDVAGGRVLGRVVLGIAACVLGSAALSSALLLLTARAVERSAPASDAAAAAWGYVLLPVSCGVLAVLGGVLTRRVLRPSVMREGPSQVGP